MSVLQPVLLLLPVLSDNMSQAEYVLRVQLEVIARPLQQRPLPVPLATILHPAQLLASLVLEATAVLPPESALFLAWLATTFCRSLTPRPALNVLRAMNVQ